MNRDTTRQQTALFARTFADMIDRDLTSVSSAREELHPRLKQAQEEAVASVLLDLLRELY